MHDIYNSREYSPSDDRVANLAPRDEVVHDLWLHVLDRLVEYMRQKKGMRHDIVNAVVSQHR